MEDKLQSASFKSIITGVFVTLAYLISNYFVITEYFFSFLNPNWHITVSVAMYTGLLNALFLYFLSKRTEINVHIYDKKNESYNVTIEEKPRTVSVKIKLVGNLEKINETINIRFPDWIDSMVKADPLINQISTSPDVYVIKPSDREVIYDFDIRIKDSYVETSRKNDIRAEISGCTLRYYKIKEELSVQYKK